MNLSGFRCDCAPGRKLPLDHYSSGACPAPPFNAEWIASMLAGVESDTHRDGRLTATRLLGCPRRAILSDEVPLTIDIRRLHVGRAGTMWHEEMARFPRADSDYGVRLGPVEVFGVPLEGELDRRSKDFSEIEDFKTHGETSMGFKWRDHRSGKVDLELAAQLNLYRIMDAKMRGVEPDSYRPKLIGWHLAMVRARRGPGEPPPKAYKGRVAEEPPPGGFRVTLPIMTEDEIGRLRPFDSYDAPGAQPYTVREIVSMYVNYRGLRSQGVPVAEAIKSAVPLVGRGVWRGTMCTRFCAAMEECDAVEGITR